MSEDGKSVANSEGSGTTVGGQSRRRRSIRNNTTFHIAHPAPTLTQKQRLLQIRPKLILQLQKSTTGSKPKPFIDVLPSTVVVPRLFKKFPRMFKGKGELGANDVMVVKSEDYDAPDDNDSEEHASDDEGLGNRDLVAVICQLRKESGGSEGKAEIVMNDGRWVASPLPNKIYEFVSLDELGHKTTARWVKKGNARKSVELGDNSGITEDSSRFTFSILDPNTRRHPIMATLTQAKLDLPDTYTISSSASKYPPTSPIRNLPGERDQPAEEEPIPERTTHVIDENLKRLIQVTAIWVALRQGWSPYFKYNDTLAVATTPTNAGPSGGRARSMSLTPDGARLGGPGTGASTPESTSGGFGAIVGGRIRQSCNRGSPASGTSLQFENPAMPQRSVSAGTAFMARNAARRGGNTLVSTVASDSEGENGFIPPKRAATEGSFAPGAQLSTPPFFGLPGSSTTTPYTPTRPQRRAQSTYIPSSVLQSSYKNEHSARHSVDGSERKPIPLVSEGTARPKFSKWKTFMNIFRKPNHGSRNE